MRLVVLLEEWATATLPDDQRWLGRTAVRFALGLVPWGVLFAAMFALLGQGGLAISLGLAAIGVSASVPALRLGSGTAVAGHLMVGALVQSLIVPAWALGGLEAACLPWLGFCVIAATLFAGPRAGIGWTLAGIAMLWGLYAAQLAGWLPAPAVPEPVLWGLAALAHTGLLAVALASIVAATDVVRRARAELEVSRAAAEEANRAKSDFLARMSHELRTPLNAILGYAELLSEEADPGTAADLARIHRSGTNLLQVVNDVLDLAKVEAGRMDFATEVIDVNSVVGAAVEAIAPLMAEHNNQVRTILAADGRAVADRLRLEQCVLNLLGNAARFTTDGEVRIVVREHGPRLHLEVHDTGIGMSDAELARVFEPFAQASAHTARVHGGTGLGLAIVRQFVERFGGTVRATSTPGAGSVFVIDLARPTATAAA